MFRLADDTTSRKVIQVANREGTESFAMLHTMPVYRPDAPRDPEVRFMETATGAPMAVRAWWQQGERTGYGFIYSEEELAALNRTAATESRASARIEEPAEVAEPVAEGPIARPDVVDGDGVPAEEPELVAQAPVQQAPPPEPQSEVRQETREELPQTASPLALLFLGGLASTTLGLRLLRRS